MSQKKLKLLSQMAGAIKAFGALLLFVFIEANVANSVLNNRPIIGVLSQEYHGGIKKNSSIIAASYVKYLESAGARVVPILLNKDQKYYETIVNYTNGVLFPGGSVFYQEPTSGYGKAGKIIFDLANQANDRGDYYPLWATCLGYEMLTYLAAGRKEYRIECDVEDLPLALELTEGYQSSRLFQSMPSDVHSYITQLPVTINYHVWCLTPENFTKSGLTKYFKILSTNRDTRNQTFVSTIEALSHPYYGVAWHPEKNNFEFVQMKDYSRTPHSYEAVRVSQHFANFFVNEARKSTHSFPDEKTEQKYMIYNFNPLFTLPRKSKFAQEYFFPLY